MKKVLLLLLIASLSGCSTLRKATGVKRTILLIDKDHNVTLINNDTLTWKK